MLDYHMGTQNRGGRQEPEVIGMSQWAETSHLHLLEGVPTKEIARRL